jgi:thiol:disulfide interchange protein
MGVRGRIAVTALVVMGTILVAFQHSRTGSGMTLQSVDDARQKAQRNHKYLMVEFRADWCSDCRMLSRQLLESQTQATIAERFMVVQVDVGEFNRNLDIARALGVDVNQGIPAAAFFEPDGRVSFPRIGNRQILEYVKKAGE